MEDVIKGSKNDKRAKNKYQHFGSFCIKLLLHLFSFFTPTFNPFFLWCTCIPSISF